MNIAGDHGVHYHVHVMPLKLGARKERTCSYTRKSYLLMKFKNRQEAHKYHTRGIHVISCCLYSRQTQEYSAIFYEGSRDTEKS